MRVYDELFNFDLEQVLHQQVSRRLLAVAGEKEVASILKGLQDFSQLEPSTNRTVAKAPNAHHGWNGELPQLFTEMIRAWVQNTALPTDLIRVN